MVYDKIWFLQKAIQLRAVFQKPYRYIWECQFLRTKCVSREFIFAHVYESASFCHLSKLNLTFFSWKLLTFVYQSVKFGHLKQLWQSSTKPIKIMFIFANSKKFDFRAYQFPRNASLCVLYFCEKTEIPVSENLI